VRAALLFVALAVMPHSCIAAQMQSRQNPIRKVVNMLQQMSKKVTAEGEKAAELHEKFMCYCKTGVAALKKSIEDAGDKIPELEAAIKASVEEEAKMKQELSEAESDRSSAKRTISEATKMREKEKAAFEAEKAEYEANLAAIGKAATAIEAGMSGEFLQTSAAQVVKNILAANRGPGASLNDDDRESLTNFLQGQSEDGYAPAAGEITGIMKQMSDEMSANLAQITKDEEAAVKEYQEMMVSKEKEVKALDAAIEKKLEEATDLGVKIAELKNDLGDSADGLE